MAITSELIKTFSQRFSADPNNIIARNTVVRNGLNQSAVNSDLGKKYPFVFSTEIKGGEITNQKSSGRCWMFASLNTMRVNVMGDYNLGNFEFSETYPFFWDKFEKSNYFLENILDTLSEPTDGRLIQHLLQAPVQDGGQWDMFKGLLAKYGAVPKYAMPEAFSSTNSAKLGSLLTLKLRSNACILREGHQAGQSAEELRQAKEGMLYDIYQLLCIVLGTPPTEFDFEYRDKDNLYHADRKITPQVFFQKYVGWNLKQKLSLINAPTKDKPYGKAYTVKYLGTVHEADPIRYINVPSDVLKQAAIASLKDGHAVWFGCDVGQNHDRETAVMAMDAFDFETLLKTGFPLDKAQRLDYGESCLTHAMVFVGVDLDEDGKPLRWKVENSWGSDIGANKGYFIMSDEWFDEYNYQVVVDQQYIPDKWLKAYDEPVIELEPWDPMGALAMVQ